MADVAYILRDRAFHFAIDNQRGTNYSIDRQKEQAIKTLTCAEMLLSEQGGIDIDVQSGRETVTRFEEIAEGKIIQRGQGRYQERTPGGNIE
jgi:hypothetical protein